MVRHAVLRRRRLLLVGAALWLDLGCGDGDRLPAPAALPRERTPEAPAGADAPGDAEEPEASDSEDEPSEPPARAPAAAQPVGLQLTLPQDAGIDTITYTIERDGEVLAEAVIPITASQAVGLQIGNLPPGARYTVSLLVMRGALPPCAGSSEFEIVEGRTTAIALALTCPGA